MTVIHSGCKQVSYVRAHYSVTHSANGDLGDKTFLHRVSYMTKRIQKKRKEIWILWRVCQ